MTYIEELLFDNCDVYNTVTNITNSCGDNMDLAENNCYPECIAALFTAAHTCKYLFIRAGLYEGLMDILKSCSEYAHSN